MIAPGRLSRYRLCRAVRLADGSTIFTDPEPFRFTELSDNWQRKVVEGDNWWSLASEQYEAPGVVAEPTDLWWVIFDFQPEPPVDPTLRLEKGTTIYGPSLENVFARILSESRRVEFR